MKKSLFYIHSCNSHNRKCKFEKWKLENNESVLQMNAMHKIFCFYERLLQMWLPFIRVFLFLLCLTLFLCVASHFYTLHVVRWALVCRLMKDSNHHCIATTTATTISRSHFDALTTSCNGSSSTIQRRFLLLQLFLNCSCICSSRIRVSSGKRLSWRRRRWISCWAFN